MTKSQVGPGNVENYGIATQQQAEAGTDGASYMTPERTKQAIDKFAPVKSVAGKTGAVSLEKSDVGLGNVENFGIASQGEAEAGTANDKYMPRFAPLRRSVSSVIKSRNNLLWLLTSKPYCQLRRLQIKMVGVSVYFRVETGVPVVSVRIKYTDYTAGGTIQYLDLMPSKEFAIGSYTLPVTYVLCKSGPIDVQVSASTSSRVYEFCRYY